MRNNGEQAGKTYPDSVHAPGKGVPAATFPIIMRCFLIQIA